MGCEGALCVSFIIGVKPVPADLTPEQCQESWEKCMSIMDRSIRRSPNAELCDTKIYDRYGCTKRSAPSIHREVPNVVDVARSRSPANDEYEPPRRGNYDNREAPIGRGYRPPETRPAQRPELPPPRRRDEDVERRPVVPPRRDEEEERRGRAPPRRYPEEPPPAPVAPRPRENLYVSPDEGGHVDDRRRYPVSRVEPRKRPVAQPEKWEPPKRNAPTIRGEEDYQNREAEQEPRQAPPPRPPPREPPPPRPLHREPPQQRPPPREPPQQRPPPREPPQQRPPPRELPPARPQNREQPPPRPLPAGPPPKPTPEQLAAREEAMAAARAKNKEKEVPPREPPPLPEKQENIPENAPKIAPKPNLVSPVNMPPPLPPPPTPVPSLLHPADPPIILEKALEKAEKRPAIKTDSFASFFGSFGL